LHSQNICTYLQLTNGSWKVCHILRFTFLKTLIAFEIKVFSELDLNFLDSQQEGLQKTGFFTKRIFSVLLLKVSAWLSNHTAKTKCGKFETNIPRKGISGPQSQFPHSCVCERIEYSHDGSAFSAGGNMWTDPGNI
jgi:hypothetical protein